MSENASELILRPFDAHDFPQLVDLMARTWLPECPGAPGRLASTAELCEYLGQTTWSMVAEQDGRLLGAALLAEGDGGAEGAEAWIRLARQARDEAAGDPSCQRVMDLEMAVVEEERALADDFRASGAPEARCALKLLVVSPEAKGRGIGGRLFSAVRDHLTARGERGYHLLTDDSCDVSFYDHMGLRRVVRRRSQIAWPGAPEGGDLGVYLYAERL